MGLLDGLGEFVKTPEGQGLLSAAFGGMAGARRGQPWNTAGRAGMAGLLGYQQANENIQKQADTELNNQLRRMQVEQYRDKKTSLSNLKESVGPELAPYVDVAPEVVVQSKFKKPEAPQLVTVQTPSGPMQKWVRPGESSGVELGAPVDKEAVMPWYARRNPDGTTSIDPAFAELEKTKASFGRAPAQPMQPVAYVDGNGNTVWGTIAEAKGKPAANFNPTLQGVLAEAKKSGQVIGESKATATIDAPRVIDNANRSIQQVDDLLKHPGFEQAVGKSSMLGVQKIPGTQGYDFISRLDQIKGSAFLDAFNSLKGGGQITEIEGKKATDSIARMNNATSEKEFKQAAEDYKAVIRAGVNRAKMRAGASAQAPSQSAQQGGVKFLGFE